MRRTLMPDNITRKSILDDAAECVCQDRDIDYGDPENSFEGIGGLWTAFLKAKGITLRDSNGAPYAIDGHDTGMMLTLMKVGRIATGHTKADNYIDGAGYMACAGEIACKPVSENIVTANKILLHNPTFDEIKAAVEEQDRLKAEESKSATEAKPSKWEGMSNEELFKEICLRFKRKGGFAYDCESCPMSSFNNGRYKSCLSFFESHPDEARQIMIKWLKQRENE